MLSGEHLVDVLGDGAHLTLGFAGAEDEIIGDGGQLGDVEDQNITGLLVEGGLRDGQGFSL
jgi:hypothetical protein